MTIKGILILVKAMSKRENQLSLSLNYCVCERAPPLPPLPPHLLPVPTGVAASNQGRHMLMQSAVDQ